MNRKRIDHVYVRTGNLAKRRRGGFSIVEVMVAAALLAIAISGISGSMLSALALNNVNRDTSIAQQAARRVIEQAHGVQFDQIFFAFNSVAGDTVGIEFGPNFAVPGLEPIQGDPDGFVGQVMFPTVAPVGGGPEDLREDVNDPALGMPRDLDLSGGAPDALPHQNDYRLLPMRVRLQWQGVAGPRQLDLETMFSAR